MIPTPTQGLVILAITNLATVVHQLSKLSSLVKLRSQEKQAIKPKKLASLEKLRS